MHRENGAARWGPATACRLAVALLVLASHAFSQKNDWRFWKSSDGFVESFVRSVTEEPDGSILVRHGDVNSLSILDGYGVRRLPELQRGSIVDWGIKGRAYLQSNGDIWAVDRGELRRYRSGTWLLEARADTAHPMLAAVPAGEDLVLVLFSDRLTAYSPNRHTWSVLKRAAETCLGSFTEMVPGFFSDFWITGQSGVARLKLRSDGAAIWTQSDVRRLGLEAANYPMPAPGQELYFSARTAGRSLWEVVRWSAAGLEVLATGNQDNLQGWQGPDGELWVLDGTSLWRAPSGHPEARQKTGALSGTVYDVLPTPDGSFWLGMVDGLVKYSPSCWRTPAPVGDLDSTVHSIAEDTHGRLWFAATEFLLELDGTTWRRHPLPLGLRTHAVHTRAVSVLADGRVLVKARTADGVESLLRFDPRNQRFETIAHPLGRTISLIVPRGDGTFWVRTKPGFHIELYDGETFRPQFDLPPTWKGDDVRCILETAGGMLWIGGTVGAMVGKGGHFRELKTMEGYAENGGFEFAGLGQNRMLVGGHDTLQYFDGRKWSLWKSDMDRVRTIAQTRDGTLWVASGSGLHRLQNGSWFINGEDEGLPAAAVSVVFQDSRGRVWVGTSRGLSLYHPEADLEAPAVGFAPADNMRETGPDGQIRVFFSGIDKWKHTPAGNLLYSYRLDSAPWSPFVESSSAALHGLRAGPHSVSVRGMDRNGNIRQSSGPFDFRVALPWYRQTGFFVIVTASSLIVVALLVLAVSNYRERSRFIVELNGARMAAETASMHKGQFLANMSHEIRTPMNGIIGMTGMALELAAGEQQRGYLSTVLKVSNSLLALLNDILDFSKVEAGKLALVPADFDLRECVQDTLRTLEVHAREKGLVLAMQIDPGVPRFVAGDDRRLGQIILNLVGNAVKFSATGEIRVEVRLVSQTAQEADLEFVVSDHGIGIPAEKQQAIFAPFEQADGSTTRKYGGTGLGLAISAKLAGLMHGRIWVESPWPSRESGRMMQGSAFHFAVTLPLGKAPVEQQAKAVRATLRNLRVLLAEDNLVNQKVAVHLLRRNGHAVWVANNGREALEIAQRESLDIVLMDVQMPEMDGFQATAAIREWERGSGRRLPIVALTAHAMDGDRERCLAHGFDQYLAKPFRADELNAVLAEAAWCGSAPARPGGAPFQTSLIAVTVSQEEEP